MSKMRKEGKAPEESFDISGFRKEDAEGLVRLFRRVYGELYPIRLFYDPLAIIKANEEGRYKSIVARTAQGKVIGATHLSRSAPYQSLFESGVGLVDSDYRNLGVNLHLMDYLSNEYILKNEKIEEVFGEAVCNHLITQKIPIKYKYVETGVEIALMPSAAYDKNATGRVASVLSFRAYRPKRHQIYLPTAYERELRVIYGRLDDVRDISLSEAKLPGSLKSHADLSFYDFANVARIAVREMGVDFAAYFGGIENEAISRKAAVIQVWLDLTKPWIGEAVEELRSRGYFFGGALPRWFDGDGLMLQKLLCKPYFESIQLLTNESKRLLEVIKKDWERVNGMAHITGS